MALSLSLMVVPLEFWFVRISFSSTRTDWSGFFGSRVSSGDSKSLFALVLDFSEAFLGDILSVIGHDRGCVEDTLFFRELIQRKLKQERIML